VLLPYVPADTVVLAMLIVPLLVIGPPVKPEPALTDVTVPLVVGTCDEVTNHAPVDDELATLALYLRVTILPLGMDKVELPLLV